MSQCVSITESNQLIVSGTTCDYVLLTQTELTVIQNAGLQETLNSLFEFSVEDFGLIHTALIVAFIVGHSAGRVARLLGKT
jgi:hypothetical protein